MDALHGCKAAARRMGADHVLPSRSSERLVVKDDPTPGHQPADDALQGPKIDTGLIKLTMIL